MADAYQSGHYTNAILDSIRFIGELIREKTGLEADGVALVGQALGGQNPKLKITKLQTDSDQNIQKGILQILQGIYQAIRNPRSHEKYSDSLQDAEALILFMNYLATTIDKATGQFDKDAFLKQVFDPYFTEDDRYASLLVERIPKGKRWDILLQVYRTKQLSKGYRLSYFFRALLQTLSAEEMDEFCTIVSQDLETTCEDATIRSILRDLPPSLWIRYSEVARRRIENKLIDAIGDGKYDSQMQKCISGGLGTWISSVGAPFFLRDDRRQLDFPADDN